MAKAKTLYKCGVCDYQTASHLGKCPECGTWGSLEECTQTLATGKAALSGTTSRQQAAQWLAEAPLRPSKAVCLENLTMTEHARFSSGMGELDRVLGGGFLPGAYVLIGGDPGIGKSTLMLQMAYRLTASGKRVLYVAGEESAPQIRLRAERLGLLNPKNTEPSGLHLLAETDLSEAIDEIRVLKPDLVILDSIQAVFDPELNSPPGTPSQLKACASRLLQVAKTLHVAIVLVGHVTKEGQLSGPKLLEHTVDCVLNFEGERYKDLRLLRASKNRFGSTQEIGVFEMVERGLREVTNPSELFLGEQATNPPPGCVTVCTMEGSRPLLVELQALVGQTAYSTPRRVVNGIETNRLHQIVAVLERRLGLDFSRQDLYVNVVGGLRIEEPAADLGVALALLTSLRGVSLPPGTVVVGEIGLTGEIRPIRRMRERLVEAQKIGFSRMLAPGSSEGMGAEGFKELPELEILPVYTLLEAVKAGLGGAFYSNHPVAPPHPALEEALEPIA